jgi:GntR family transcriptional regulator, rspAB operon transcriptional repressor
MKRFKGNLTENAYRFIRDRILRGELPFGARLSRRVLAGELGISIVPVGDALQRLETDGLVESRPRVGTRVRLPTARAIRGHFVLREALESQSARIFAEKATPAQHDEIRRMAAELDALYAAIAQDPAAAAPADASYRQRLFELHELHMRFHMRVAECTDCDELCRAIEKNQVLVFNWLYDTAFGNQTPPPGWHTELAGALTAGSVDVADAAMRRHTRYRMDELLQRVEPNAGWTKTPAQPLTKRARRRRGRLKRTGSVRNRARVAEPVTAAETIA